MPSKARTIAVSRVAVSALLGAAAAFVVLNFGYVSARVSLLVRGPNSVSAVPTPSPSEVPASEPEPRMTPDRVVVPSLGIDAPLVYVEEKTEAAFQVGLRDGVVHYPGTALPGDVGNAYYFGHSSDYAWSKGSYKTVFATLPEIKVGAVVTVSDRAGRAYAYKVTGTRVVSPKDLSVLAQGDGTQKLLTLQTSYPLGTALKRFVAVAELME